MRFSKIFIILIIFLLFEISINNVSGAQVGPKVLWKIDNVGPQIEIDDENNIYTVNRTSLIKIMPDGHIVWNVTIYPAPWWPLVYNDTVYVTSYIQPPPCGGTSPRYLYAISVDGHIKWKHEFQPSSWGGFSQMVVNKYGEIFLNSDDGYTYAVYPNGTLKWKLKTDAWSGSDPAIYHNTLYVATRGLYAMDFNGTIKWMFKNKEIGFTPVIGKDGTIYVAFDKLYAISPNGVVKWKASIKGYVPTLDYNKGRIYTVAGGLVGHNSTLFLYALDTRNGDIIWKTEIGGNEITIPAVDKNGYIYLTNNYARNDTGYLFCISPRGKIIWRFKLDGGGTILPPVVGKDGTIYVGTDKGILYAINYTSAPSVPSNSNDHTSFLLWGGIIASVVIAIILPYYLYRRRRL